MLRVLARLSALEPAQADLLTRTVEGPAIDSDSHRSTGSLGGSSSDSSDGDEGETGEAMSAS